MQENCKYPGEMRGGGAAERKARWCHPWKLLTRLPLFCSSTFISLFIIYLFPSGSSTLVLSLIKEQRVAGLTCQIFQWPLYRQQRYQAAKNRGTKKKKPNKWFSMIRRGTSWLFAFIWAPKKLPPVRKESHKKKKSNSLWRATVTASALLAILNVGLITQGKQEWLSVNEQHNPEAEF